MPEEIMKKLLVVLAFFIFLIVSVARKQSSNTPSQNNSPSSPAAEQEKTNSESGPKDRDDPLGEPPPFNRIGCEGTSHRQYCGRWLTGSGR
jgi:hypothetical protein